MLLHVDKYCTVPFSPDRPTLIQYGIQAWVQINNGQTMLLCLMPHGLLHFLTPNSP